MPVCVGEAGCVSSSDFVSTAERIPNLDPDFKLFLIWKDICPSSFLYGQKCLKWDLVYGKCFYWLFHVLRFLLGSTGGLGLNAFVAVTIN